MTSLLDELQNRFRLFSYDEESIKEFVHKLERAKFLTGYSSMIYEVAKIVNQMGLNNRFNLKMIKGTSEKYMILIRMKLKKHSGRKL